jgi:hypothetical protein
MIREEQREELRQREERQKQQLQKIARHYDRLEEKLAELEAMLPQYEAEAADEAPRPRKPK